MSVMRGGTYGETYEEAMRVHTDLLYSGKYNKYVKPRFDQSSPVQVNVSLYLYSIDDFDDSSETLQASGFVDVSWIDEILTWDPEIYGNISFFLPPVEKVWKPQLKLDNAAVECSIGNACSPQRLYVFHYGFVFWSTYTIIKTKCNMNIKYFPFDVQTCKIVYEVWEDVINDYEIINKTEFSVNSESSNFGQWQIKNISTRLSSESNHAILFELVLVRGPSNYIIYILVPLVTMGWLKLLVFVIPVRSGEKIGYSVTVFLSFVVYLTVISAELPKISGSILTTYITLEIVYSAVFLLLAGIIVRFYFIDGCVPEKIAKAFLCRKRTFSAINMTWADFADKMDFFLLLFSTVLTVVTTITIATLYFS